MTTWLFNDPENMRYFALTPMISLPIGTYDASRAMNIGENRYKATLSAGYIDRFLYGQYGELFAEFSLEFAYFWENSNAKGYILTQKPTYALTSYLRYRPIPIIGVFRGYQINGGGETSLSGIPQNDTQNTQRWMIGGALFTFGTQIMIRYSQDIKIDNGFKTNDQIILRFQWILGTSKNHIHSNLKFAHFHFLTFLGLISEES